MAGGFYEKFPNEWGLWLMLSDLRRGADGGSYIMPKSTLRRVGFWTG